RPTTTAAAARASTTGRCRGDTPPAAARPTGRHPRRAARSDSSAPAQRAEKGRRARATLALHLLYTVVVQRQHDARACYGGLGAGVFQAELECVLLEKIVEHLAAERAEGVDLVAPRVVLEQDRRERLGGGACHDPCAFGR